MAEQTSVLAEGTAQSCFLASGPAALNRSWLHSQLMPLWGRVLCRFCAQLEGPFSGLILLVIFFFFFCIVKPYFRRSQDYV